MPESAPTIHDDNILYTIGELAREYQVTTRTLRFYESVGLLNPTRDGQKRFYNRRDRTRLKLALRGKRLGMTLAEIKEIFDLYDSAQGERGQITRFLDILQAKRELLLRQQQDIEEALAELEVNERRCRAILGRSKRHARSG